MNNATIAVIALVSALAVVGLVVITVAALTIPMQQAEAGCERGFPHNAPAFNASKGRCFHP
jgi:hypothetical protein